MKVAMSAIWVGFQVKLRHTLHDHSERHRGYHSPFLSLSTSSERRRCGTTFAATRVRAMTKVAMNAVERLAAVNNGGICGGDARDKPRDARAEPAEQQAALPQPEPTGPAEPTGNVQSRPQQERSPYSSRDESEFLDWRDLMFGGD